MIVRDEEAMLIAGRQLAAVLAPGDKISLSGTLGAGKTTLARGILRGLGFEADVPSPTFAIVQQYDPPEVKLPLAHVDLYRIEHPDQLLELGLDDTLIDGALVVEWPDRMSDLFWQDGLNINLKIESDNTRRLTWSAGTAWKDRWPPT